MGATDLIQEVIHARKRVEVMDSHFVERPEVDPKAERAIIPLEEAGFQNPIAGGRNDIPLVTISVTAASMRSWSRGECRRVAMRIGVASPV